MKKTVLILLFLLANMAYGQKIVTGQITDNSSNAIEGVKVKLLNSSNKTFTNAQGKYSIEIPEGSNKLEFSKKNFKAQELEISSDTIDITMNLLVEENLFELSLEELMNINVTSVSKKSESVFEVPQSIIVITDEDIKNRGYIDIEQVFHDLPGFDISRGNGPEYSQIYQRGYRSNNTDRTLLLVDGVEENDLWSNSAWISRQFPLSNIKRIEVLYGPSSTIYGANAYLGVINIITKSADDIAKNSNHIGINAQVNYGTWNTWSTDVTLAAKKNETSFEITGRIFKSDEMDLSKYKDWDYNLTDYNVDFYKNMLNTADDLLAQKAMDYDQQIYYNDPSFEGIKPYFSDKTDIWYLKAKLKIAEFTFGFESWKNNEGYGAWYRDDYELGNKGGRWIPHNTSMYANYEKQISDKLMITSITTFKIHQIDDASEEYYYVGYLNGRLGMNDLLEKKDTLITYDNTSNKLDTAINPMDPNPYWWHAYYHTYSQQARSELRLLYTFNDKINIITGSEIRGSMIQGQYLISEKEFPSENAIPPNFLGGNNFSSIDFGYFAQIEYKPVSNLNIIVGGRVDYNRIRRNGGYGWVFNPKAAVVYSPSALVFKFIYSQAFKDADNFTKFSTAPGRLLSNPTLEPEKVKNAEFSVGWKINEYIYFDACTYYSIYSDIVGTKDVTFTDASGAIVTTTQHQPIGEMTITGLQSNINFKYANYTAYANYTYTSPYNTSETEKIRIGDIADHHVNTGINALYFNKLNINLRANWVSARPTGINTTISENPLAKIDAFFLLSGTLSYQVWKGITAQLIVNNILDNEYFDPGVRSANGEYYASQLPQNRRSFAAKLLFEF